MLYLTPASCIHSNPLLIMWSPSLLLRQNDIVSGPVMENSVLVSGGESIHLTCTFKIKGYYSYNPFVVYWIKTGAQSSTCVYSFSYVSYGDSGFDDHCAIDKDLLLRRSHTSRPFLDDNNIHNLKISNATQSDRGQYLCVLQVNIYNQQYWAVITNTTVIVDNPDSYLIYVIGVLVPVLLLLPVIIIIIIIILLKRKSAETKVSQTAITQRFQNGEEVDDDDCSPYAMGQGEQEPTYSLIQLTNQKTDPVFSGDGELASDPSADEGIMRKNSIYETSGP
ncbi:uncharacterized protein LOC116217959 isoform X1 [Clupea harengus]|uniref:Uncharacterized protein LOC116217959 isoform X1 n=1 Tax=Clupea harengus TaxID=7950 RepID=A0A6P8EN94_CLUHA|nr:uncharacterized protein LOC116217959 isoform X1 [Clupea harengus]XP_031413802.1 uncharacterized protein LOC116217959 isoform X1 [Clupea harengus]XP_042566727.1 uncharacterized protein LOC116217959 isoform X1 [Clupea harengus]